MSETSPAVAGAASAAGAGQRRQREHRRAGGKVMRQRRADRDDAAHGDELAVAGSHRAVDGLASLDRAAQQGPDRLGERPGGPGELGEMP